MTTRAAIHFAAFLSIGSLACAAELELAQLQGDWRVADYKSGKSGGVIRIRDGTVSSLKTNHAQTLVFSSVAHGASILELLPGSRILLVGRDSKPDGMEIGTLFRVDVISDGLLLRSGNLAWSLTRLTEAESKELSLVAKPTMDAQPPPARPQIVKQQQVRPAIFAENKFGTQNIGNIAVDAKWSNYGAYLQRMIEAVQLEWDKILSESRSYPGSGTYVAVKFVLDKEGRIARIVEVDNHSTEQGSRACVNAITNRAPYGPWTEDMKAVLGQQQEMAYTFYYQ